MNNYDAPEMVLHFPVMILLLLIHLNKKTLKNALKVNNLFL